MYAFIHIKMKIVVLIYVYSGITGDLVFHSYLNFFEILIYFCYKNM